MTDQPELKPCPFCGGRAHPFTGMGRSGVSMRCQRCEMLTSYFHTKQQAISAWNSRA